MPEKLKYYIIRGNRKYFVTIPKSNIGKGGMGEVFKVGSPRFLRNSVFKRYPKKKRPDTNEIEKVKYLTVTRQLPGVDQLLWPSDVVYECEGDAVAGFLMPQGGNMTLESYYAKHLQKRENYLDALSIAASIAKSVAVLHGDGRFVHGDLKPQNFLIRESGQESPTVQLIDLDNVQILDQRVMFRFSACSAEYLYPEFRKEEASIRSGKKPIVQGMDDFALAVILYKIFYGIHPFSGTRLSPSLRQHTGNTLSDRIDSGLFPFGIHGDECRPTSRHIPFKRTHFLIKGMFVRAFKEGFKNSSVIPSALEWADLLELASSGKLGIGLFPRPILPGLELGELPPGAKIPFWNRRWRRGNYFEEFPVSVFRLEPPDGLFVWVKLNKKAGYEFFIRDLTTRQNLDWGVHGEVAIKMPYRKTRLKLVVKDKHTPRRWSAILHVGYFENRLSKVQSPLGWNGAIHFQNAVDLSGMKVAVQSPQIVNRAASLTLDQEQLSNGKALDEITRMELSKQGEFSVPELLDQPIELAE